MKSLRLRFFIISWPIVVLAVLLVAVGVERWATVELNVIERSEIKAAAPGREPSWSDSLAAAWSTLGSAPGQAVIGRLAGRVNPPVHLVVTDVNGQVLASSDTTLRLARRPSSADGMAEFERSLVSAGGVVESRLMAVGGLPLISDDGKRLGTVYALPVRQVVAPPRLAGLRDKLRRMLWWTVLVASLASAGAALLLAGPLVRQVRRLTVAAGSIRGGALGTRLPGQGGGEIADLERSFNAMAESLARADALKRNMVTDVAHELRTPLTNILGSIEAMQDGLIPAGAAALSSLREEAGLLAALVTELQELSLAESGQIAFDFESVDCVAVATAAVEAMRVSAGDVALHGPGTDEHPFASVDERRLTQVIRNLLRNAIAYTPPGGQVRVEVADHDDRIVISVADTGHGIPESHLPLIWERFHRVDPSRDRASGGMGLGLALVRQLVEGMGGTVAAESREGAGSVFRVMLPRVTGSVEAEKT
jgi:signal transduction histidine kinase